MPSAALPGRLHQAGLRFPVRFGGLGIARVADEITIDQPCAVGTGDTFGLVLPEERCQFPELMRLAVIERMFVTLHALNLPAQEHLRRFGRGLNAAGVGVGQ